MQYGQIVFLLFVAMVFYYAAMIFMDLQRAKAAQNAEQDSHKEEDIDNEKTMKSQLLLTPFSGILPVFLAF